MTIQIELKPEVQAGLAARARARGMPLDAYVQSVLEQFAFPLQPLDVSATAEDRARAFREWTDTFPSRRGTPLSDEDISRESLYGNPSVS